MTPTVLLLISFLSDFLITAGSIIGGAMMEGGTVVVPNRAVIVLSLVMGVVVAARRAQALIQAPPGKAEELERTIGQLMTQLRAPQPVTPARVPLPEDPKPVKDSS